MNTGPMILVCPDCQIDIKKGQLNCPECGQHKSYFVARDSEPGEDIDAVEREGGYRVSSVTFKAETFPVTTSNFVPGNEVTDLVGIVFTSSNRRTGLTTTNLASNTFKDAFQELESKAKKMGADAIISLQIGVERAGPNAVAFSQTTTLVGTAVKLAKKRK